MPYSFVCVSFPWIPECQAPEEQTVPTPEVEKRPWEELQ